MSDESVLGIDIGTCGNEGGPGTTGRNSHRAQRNGHTQFRIHTRDGPSTTQSTPGGTTYSMSAQNWHPVRATVCAGSVSAASGRASSPATRNCARSDRRSSTASIPAQPRRSTNSSSNSAPKQSSHAVGSALSSQAVGPKLLWLRRHEERCLGRRHQGWYMASSFIVGRLTGEYVLDHHSASQCDPLYDLNAATWAEDWASEIAPRSPSSSARVARRPSRNSHCRGRGRDRPSARNTGGRGNDRRVGRRRSASACANPAT